MNAHGEVHSLVRDFGLRLRASERGLQLMRRVGNEIPLCAAGFLKLRQQSVHRLHYGEQLGWCVAKSDRSEARR
jgi:hypothetical protein